MSLWHHEEIMATTEYPRGECGNKWVPNATRRVWKQRGTEINWERSRWAMAKPLPDQIWVNQRQENRRLTELDLNKMWEMPGRTPKEKDPIRRKRDGPPRRSQPWSLRSVRRAKGSCLWPTWTWSSRKVQLSHQWDHRVSGSIDWSNCEEGPKWSQGSYHQKSQEARAGPMGINNGKRWQGNIPREYKGIRKIFFSRKDHEETLRYTVGPDKWAKTCKSTSCW